MRGRRGERSAESSFKNFARGVAGKRIEGDEAARDFVRGDAGAEERAELVEGERGAGPQDDAGNGNFAADAVILADDRDVGHGGVLSYVLFHFAGVDVEAGNDEHIFLSVEDGEVAILIADAEVTGADPALHERARSFLGLIEVGGKV